MDILKTITNILTAKRAVDEFGNYIRAKRKSRLAELKHAIEQGRFFTGATLVNMHRQARKRLCMELGINMKQLRKHRVLRGYKFDEKTRSYVEV